MRVRLAMPHNESRIGVAGRERYGELPVLRLWFFKGVYVNVSAGHVVGACRSAPAWGSS